MVRVVEEESDPAVTGRGANRAASGHWCYVEAMVTAVQKQTEQGVSVGGHPMQAVNFADYQTMIISGSYYKQPEPCSWVVQNVHQHQKDCGYEDWQVHKKKQTSFRD